MAVKTVISGYLEIDHQRGVIYFHADPLAALKHEVPTVLRLSALPHPIPEIKGRMLDVSHPVWCDWPGEEGYRP
jgi:hypothetical protein